MKKQFLPVSTEYVHMKQNNIICPSARHNERSIPLVIKLPSTFNPKALKNDVMEHNATKDDRRISYVIVFD